MVKALEALAGDDATRFRDAIRPHLDAVLAEEGYASPAGLEAAIESAESAQAGAALSASLAAAAATSVDSLRPTPMQAGAVGDGVANDTTPFLTACAAGATVFLGGRRYKISGQYTLPADVTIIGPGEIIFTNDSDFLRFGARNYVEGVTFTGTLSTTTQFQLVQNGVAAYFAAPTYQDYAAGVVSGSDFVKSVSGAVLSVNLPAALTGQLGRMVVSSVIALDSTAKYAIAIDDDFVFGDGAAPLQCWITDASGNELSQFVLADTGPTLFISGAAGIKFKAGCARHDHTKRNLTATWDLSKIKVYKLLNDLAAIGAGTALENSTNIACYTTDVTIRRCTFRRFKFAAMKFVNSARSRFHDNAVHSCLGGVSTQTSTGDEFLRNHIDLNAFDSAGNRVPTGIAVRNHCINIMSVNGARSSYNTELGASWATENAEGGSLSFGVDITHNKIDAVHCGVSASADKSVVAHNQVRFSSLGLYGIELPTASYASCVYNSVWQSTPAINSYGVAAANVTLETQIAHNTIRAGNGISAAPPTVNGDKALEISHNVIQCWTQAIATSVGGTTVFSNKVRYIGRFSGQGTAPNAAIRCSTSFYRCTIRANVVEGAGAYVVYVNQAQDHTITDNDLIGFGGEYDVYYNISTSYKTVAKVVNNTFRTSVWGAPRTGAFIGGQNTPVADSYFTLRNYQDSGAVINQLTEQVANVSPAFYYTPDNFASTSSGAASYTATIADQYAPIRMTSASANTVTIPPSSTTRFPVRALLEVQQAGAGPTTVAAGSGVTIQKLSGASLTTSGQYAVLRFRQVALDTWMLL